MPAVFLGHGSPMNALSSNAFTAFWSRLGQETPRPRAILCVSAHWMTRGSRVTAMAAPRTIHDFGNFPPALFAVRYPAAGDPALARKVKSLLAPTRVTLDEGGWGLDHGTWAVLVHAYPAADVPVVQLSLDEGLAPAAHFELARRLAPLRGEGVLILGTGNIVHNLPRMDWRARERPAYDWAARFGARITGAIAADRPAEVIGFESLGEDAALSVPSPEHFWPLLYVLGARLAGDHARLETDVVEYGSLSMTSVVLQPALTPRPEHSWP